MRVVTMWALALMWALTAGAQEEAPAPPAEAAPAEAAAGGEEAPAPDLDALLEDLVKLNPEQLAGRLAEMKVQAEQAAAQAAEHRAQAEALEAEAKALGDKLSSLEGHIKALAALFAPSSAEEAPMMQAAAPAPAPEPAAAEGGDLVTVNFADHVMPIFKARCASCHNEDRRRGGLSLESHAASLAGGSSGAVLLAGDPDGSRLLRLVTKAEEPSMPPSGDPLTEEQIAVLREWILQGAAADATAKKLVKAAETMGEEGVFVAAKFADTPPMPESALPAPAAETERGVVARAVATSPRAKLVAVGGYRQVLLYSAEDWSCLGALPFPEGQVHTMTFSVNGELLVAGGGMAGATGVAVIWNVRTGEREGVYGEGYDTVLAVDVSPDHARVAVGGPNKVVRVYAVADGAELYKLEVHTDWILAARFSPDGELLATADRAGGLYLWQAANGRPVENLRGHDGAINALAYSADSALLASAGADGTVQVWDTWKYTRARQFKAHGNGVMGVDFAASGEIVTTGGDRLTKRWDSAGKEVLSYEALPDWGYQVDLAADDSLVLAGVWTGDIYVWDAASGERVAALSTRGR